jgi:hypothetical protein
MSIPRPATLLHGAPAPAPTNTANKYGITHTTQNLAVGAHAAELYGAAPAPAGVLMNYVAPPISAGAAGAGGGSAAVSAGGTVASSPSPASSPAAMVPATSPTTTSKIRWQVWAGGGAVALLALYFLFFKKAAPKSNPRTRRFPRRRR